MTRSGDNLFGGIPFRPFLAETAPFQLHETTQPACCTAGFFVRANASNYAGNFKKSIMIEEEQRRDCVDSIILGLNRTSEFRARKAIEYHDDARNARASLALRADPERCDS
jgi:hypothetical protein